MQLGARCNLENIDPRDISGDHTGEISRLVLSRLIRRMAPKLEEASDRMTRDEEILMIVMRTMKAMREQEEERNKKRGQ